MTRLIAIATIVAMQSGLAACTGHGAVDSDAAKNAAVTPPVRRQKTVFDEQLKALDKAKAVEKQLQEDKEKADQAIEDQGG